MPKSHRVYFRIHGTGPWSCEDCDIILIELGRRSGQGQIHHIDQDHQNDVIENLALLCRSCHALRHRYDRARPSTAKSQQKTSASLKGHPVSQETRDKIAAAQRGRVYSEERRAAMRAGWACRKAHLAQLPQRSDSS